MLTHDPTTWQRIERHPALESSCWNPDWYDGDVEVDLQMLRIAALAIQSHAPQRSFELHVLDDCTIYFSVKQNNEIHWLVYPAKTDDYESCYYLSDELNDYEIQVLTVDDVLRVLGLKSER